jgi:hypothetical protein
MMCIVSSRLVTLWHQIKPECMASLLDEIDKRGGIASVLASAGVDGSVLESVRRHVVAEGL